MTGPGDATAGLPPATRVATARLEVEVFRWGDPAAPPVMLLHGWPDAARTWATVAPALAAAGWSVIVPSLRGHGGTRWRDPAALRSGQLSALGRDVLELADALGLARFAVVGHDWGARAAYIASCLAPERVRACVAMSVGWGTNNPDQVLPLRMVQNYWYHWYMATPRGEAELRSERRAFTAHIWDVWCPYWKIDPAEFEATAVAFDNPDWADVVLHSYRSRWGHAPADPGCAALEQRLRADPRIHVPTLVLHGADDPCNLPLTSEGKEALFTGAYRRMLIERCGHFPQREHPGVVVQAVVDHLRAHPG